MVYVSGTSFPIAHTARTFRLSSMTIMSASFPRCNEPLRSYTPMIFAGVSDTIRTASANGISAFCTTVLISRSIVAILPAKAERSANLQTPSSMMTRGSKASLLSLAAQAKASVIRQVRSTPFILYTAWRYRSVLHGYILPHVQPEYLRIQLVYGLRLPKYLCRRCICRIG